MTNGGVLALGGNAGTSFDMVSCEHSVDEIGRFYHFPRRATVLRTALGAGVSCPRAQDTGSLMPPMHAVSTVMIDSILFAVSSICSWLVR